MTRVRKSDPVRGDYYSLCHEAKRIFDQSGSRARRRYVLVLSAEGRISIDVEKKLTDVRVSVARLG